MTIDPRMRRLILLTEDSKQDSLVLFADKATSKVPVLVNYVQYLDQLPSVKSKEIDALVLLLPAVTGSPSMRLGIACKTRSVVRDVSAEIEKLFTRIGKEDLHDLFGHDFKLTQSHDPENAQSGGNRFGAGGNGFGGNLTLGSPGGGVPNGGSGIKGGGLAPGGTRGLTGPPGGGGQPPAGPPAGGGRPGGFGSLNSSGACGAGAGSGAQLPAGPQG